MEDENSILCSSFPTDLKALCSTFSQNITSVRFKSAVEQRKSQDAFTKTLYHKAYDRILFGYDEFFERDQINVDTRDVCKEAIGALPRKQAENLTKLISSRADESWLKMMAVLLPLRDFSMSPKPEILSFEPIQPELPFISSSWFNEPEIFAPCEIFAVSDLPRYRDLTELLSPDTVQSVTDSAFTDVSEPVTSGTFSMLDPGVFEQEPHFLTSLEDECTDRDTAMKCSLYGALSNPLPDAPLSFHWLDFPSLEGASFSLSEFTMKGEPEPQRPDSGLGGEISGSARSSQLSSPDKYDVEHERTASQPSGIPIICWERHRRPGGRSRLNVTVRPYLTEASQEVFHVVYKYHRHCVAALNAVESAPRLTTISMSELMHDAIRLLLGASSKCFYFCQSSELFSLRPDLTVVGLSHEALSSSCHPLTSSATYFHRIYTLCAVRSASPTVRCFLSGLREFLQSYIGAVLTVGREVGSPLQLAAELRRSLHGIRLVVELCHLADLTTPCEYPSSTLPDGLALLSYLYNKCKQYSGSKYLPIILHLFKSSCQPYIEYLRGWVYTGCCVDDNGEFFIDVEPEALECKDERFWLDGYRLLEHTSCLLQPSMKNRVFLAGKSLALLRAISGDHVLLTAGIDPPIIQLCLSQSELLDQRSEVEVHMTRMRQILKSALITRQELKDEEEQARKELIVAAQREQAATLERIYKEIETRRRAQAAKKEEFHKDLMEQAQQAKERKIADAEAEKAEDQALVENLMKREQLQTQHDKELERQAREELIKYYTLLGETAEKRERLALWKIRRHQNDLLRQEFLMESEESLINEQQALDEPAERKKWQLPTLPTLPDISENLSSDDEIDFVNLGSNDTTSADLTATKDTTGADVTSRDMMTPKDALGADVLTAEEMTGRSETELPEEVGDSNLETVEVSEAALGEVAAAGVQSTDHGPKGSKPHISQQSQEVVKPTRTPNHHVSEETTQEMKSFTVPTVHVSQQTTQEIKPPRSHTVHPTDETTEQSPVRSIRTFSQHHHPDFLSHHHGIPPRPCDPLNDIRAVLALRDDLSHKFSSMDALSKLTQRDETSSMTGAASRLYDIAPSNRSVKGKHASDTTHDLKAAAIRSSIRITHDANEMSSDTASTSVATRRRAIGPHSTTQSATDQDEVDRHRLNSRGFSRATEMSDEPDSDEIRARKFRQINTRGHASHSSIQDKMYYMTEEPAESEVSLDWPEIKPISMEEAEDYYLEMKRGYVITDIDDGLSSPWPEIQQTDQYEKKDGSLYDRLPVHSIVYESIFSPLNAQMELAISAALNYFINQVEMDKHFDVLYHVVLLSNGEFAQELATPIFKKMHSYHGEQSVLSTLYLTSKLSTALERARLSDNPFYRNVVIRKAKPPSRLQPNSVTALDWLKLDYKVDWPVNIVISGEDMRLYEEIFSLQIRYLHIEHMLSDIWYSLKRSRFIPSGTQAQTQLHTLHVIRHDMEHFVSLMHNYLALRIQECWQQFHVQLGRVRDLDELRQVHNAFLRRCTKRCFLGSVYKKFQQIVDGILNSVVKFYAQIKTGVWQIYGPEDTETEMPIHSQYDNIIKMYSTYSEYTCFLNKVLTRMTSNGQQPHLQELQLMLNFNQFYDKK